MEKYGWGPPPGGEAGRGGGTGRREGLKSLWGISLVRVRVPLSAPECGSVGRAPRLGRGGPRFEPGHSD